MQETKAPGSDGTLSRGELNQDHRIILFLRRQGLTPDYTIMLSNHSDVCAKLEEKFQYGILWNVTG